MTKKLNLVPRGAAQKVLEDEFGPDVRIALEPIVEGREEQLWSFDSVAGIMGRADKLLYEARVKYREDKKYYSLVLVEEPGADEKSTTREGIAGRVVGDLIIERYSGIVVTRKNSGFNGEILELKPSSLSKGDLAPMGKVPLAYFESNPQRIEGLIAIYVVDVEEDFVLGPGEQRMSLEEFIRRTTDGRSLGAIAKAVYLKQ